MKKQCYSRLRHHHLMGEVAFELGVAGFSNAKLCAISEFLRVRFEKRLVHQVFFLDDFSILGYIFTFSKHYSENRFSV